MTITTKAGHFIRGAAMPRNCYVIARELNVVRVDFRREPDPPSPKFPGAAALRNSAQLAQSVEAFNTTLTKAEVA